jgi:Mif2/CENP-C like
MDSRPMKEVDMPVGPRATSETAAVQSGRETLRGQAPEEVSEHFDTKLNQKLDASVEDEDENSVQNPMGDDEMEEFLSGVSNAIQDVSPVRNATTEIAPKTAETVVESIEPKQPAEAPQKPAVQRNNARKRKSDEMEEPTAPSQKKPVKKPRMTKAEAQKAKALQKIGPSVSLELSTKPLPVQEALKVVPVRAPGLIKDPNTHLSQRQQAELDQIIEKVKARPGKLKTLYVLKREKSKKSGANDVRSGCAVVKPLAYWSAEQCVHNEGGAGLELGSRIPLNSIKEITRDTKKPQSNEDSDDDNDAASLNDHHEDGHEEAWEKEIGIFRGHANIWSQPDQATLEEAEETDLAYHPSSVLTREVNGSGYKFAKLVSMPFFSSGIVDLPPGAVKWPKNSRTMHMCFFVFKGRVTVSIGQGIEAQEGEEESGERFSVGKGGVFQVPRGELVVFSLFLPSFAWC